MDRVTPHILWEGWNTEWENSPLSFIDRLTQATRNYRLAQEKQRELKSAIALIHKELEGKTSTRKASMPHSPTGATHLQQHRKWKSRTWGLPGII